MNNIFKRTSVRNYKDISVEDEKIELILKAAMAAPSAMNQQPWEFYVVTNREKLIELSDATPYSKMVKDSAVTFVVCYRNDSLREMFREIDCAACTENMLLEIEDLGLGGVWIGVAPKEDNMENVRKIMDIPEILSPFALVACGYPEKEQAQKDRFNPERVHYIK